MREVSFLERETYLVMSLFLLGALHIDNNNKQHQQWNSQWNILWCDFWFDLIRRRREINETEYSIEDTISLLLLKPIIHVLENFERKTECEKVVNICRSSNFRLQNVLCSIVGVVVLENSFYFFLAILSTHPSSFGDWIYIQCTIISIKYVHLCTCMIDNRQQQREK